MSKLTSRKFWLSVAGVIGGIGTAIAGMTVENTTITIVGVICGAVSTAIYTICEAYVDAAAVDAEIITLVDDTEESEDD